MKNYFNSEGECVDCEGLAEHCRETGQVFPLMYRDALPHETLSDICDPFPVPYLKECGVDSAAFAFDIKKNSWVEDNDTKDTRTAYAGISTPLNRN